MLKGIYIEITVNFWVIFHKFNVICIYASGNYAYLCTERHNLYQTKDRITIHI
jgi:hypothetical protein